MRTSILLWSAASGAVIGVVAALLLVGAGTIAAAVLPFPGVSRLAARWGLHVALATIALLALAGALLGYLEGRLKLS